MQPQNMSVNTANPSDSSRSSDGPPVGHMVMLNPPPPQPQPMQVMYAVPMPVAPQHQQQQQQQQQQQEEVPPWMRRRNKKIVKQRAAQATTLQKTEVERATERARLQRQIPGGLSPGGAPQQPPVGVCDPALSKNSNNNIQTTPDVAEAPQQQPIFGSVQWGQLGQQAPIATVPALPQQQQQQQPPELVPVPLMAPSMVYQMVGSPPTQPQQQQQQFTQLVSLMPQQPSTPVALPPPQVLVGGTPLQMVPQPGGAGVAPQLQHLQQPLFSMPMLQQHTTTAQAPPMLLWPPGLQQQPE